MKQFTDILKEKIIVFDGAMGSNIQAQNLTVDDFGGEKYNGCNEYLTIFKPDVIKQIHSEFLSAGCDVIETNTFGGSSIVLSEYELAEKTYELNLKSAQLAKIIASDFSTSGKPRFVAGSIGPTTKLPSLGHVKFSELENAFYIQAKGLIEGGADLLVVETCQDILQTKAALVGIFSCFKALNKKIPIIVSVTIETTSTMLLGTEISAALTTIELFDIDAFGINCATGPLEMSESIRFLSANCPFPIICMPNAGLPENINGKSHYNLSPDEFAETLCHYVKDFGVSIVGGCCGTTKEHIKRLVESVKSISPQNRKIDFVPSVSSLYQSVPLQIDIPPVLVGERTNANGSKLFRDLLLKNDWEGMVALGRDQVKEGAHLLDLSVAYSGRNEVEDFTEVVSRFNTQITASLMIDSTDINAIEAALQLYGGKAIINSVNLEDGEAKFAQVINLCKKYGAAVIALTIDEDGMAKTAEKKLQIAERMHDLAVNKYQLKESNLIFDLLTFTLGSGDEEFRKSAVETLEGLRLVKRKFPKVRTSLGISNISYGLQPNARIILNSVFLYYTLQNGLDMAIVHASKILPLFKISEREHELCRKLIFDERTSSFDPLKALIEYYSDKKERKTKEIKTDIKLVEERLESDIINGDKTNLKKHLDEALLKYQPLDIINRILLKGMRIVGEYFGSGKIQLPFVLQSAEVMKAAVNYLEPHFEKSISHTKATIVLATVKGDVHDIGKNLVDIILSNNGYRVINLGIRVPIETIIRTIEEQKPDAIGMSGLLVKSTCVMKENLEVLRERGIVLPVVLGGAALNRKFVEGELQPIYNGQVAYAKDVFDGLKFMEMVSIGNKEIPTKNLNKNSSIVSIRPTTHDQKSQLDETKIPTPPFWGSKIVDEISLDEVFNYINENALFKGQWQIQRGDRSDIDYKRLLEEKVYPIYENLKFKIKNEKLLEPKVVYGYFPCHSDKDDLIIYRPKNIVDKYSVWNLGNNNLTQNRSFKTENLSKWIRFSFPRQSTSSNLCIADFFAAIDSGKIDVVAIQLVTIGKNAQKYSQKLFESNKYQDYLYFHGLSVECTEALAEMWHKKIRKELKIQHNDAPEIKEIFKKEYQGARYSFGYPACPNLEDQAKIFEILNPKRINVELTETYQLIPEQSTSAIIVHHPEAHYFKV